jgi:hypothetical protein
VAGAASIFSCPSTSRIACNLPSCREARCSRWPVRDIGAKGIESRIDLPFVLFRSIHGFASFRKLLNFH